MSTCLLVVTKPLLHARIQLFLSLVGAALLHHVYY